MSRRDCRAMKMIDPRRIAFDIDGVVADTMSSFLEIAKKDFGIGGICKEDITTYWLEQCLPMPPEVVDAVIKKILQDPFGTGLSPIPGAREALCHIAKMAPLRFVTARPVKTPIERWIHKLLSPVSPEKIQVVATGIHSAKAEVLSNMGVSFFVEDHLETCLQIEQAGIKAIIFDQPWNRRDSYIFRIHSWEELLDFIAK